ncbi:MULTISPECIES: hypothetical protein [Microbacterium]|uniref:hypothetical protein n=1 Tax=Microbacterium TaxID=33882 RepID=UPI001C2CB2AF|nr:hypothetical protein [Microbacterium paraoxydans]QXE28917.1 hypothetical protein IZR02_11000 [Microbacterium paraoxydans]
MKRIYYGSLTIDVSDETAKILLQLAEESFGNIRRSGQSAFAVGYAEQVTVTGYLGDAENITDVTLVLSNGVSLAVAPVASKYDRPNDEMTLPQLEAQLREYHSN